MNRNVNIDIKSLFKQKGFVYWQVADAMGISESTLIRWLRKPLDRDKRELILNAVQNLDRQTPN